MAQTGCQATEGVKAVPHESVDTYAVTLSLILRPLQGAEEAGRARDGNGHEPEAPEDARPFLGVDTLEPG